MIKFYATTITFLFTLTLCFGQEGEILVPEFSHASGHYLEEFDLSISHPNLNSGTSIIYTLDGSEPKIEHVGGTTYLYKNNYQETANDSLGEFYTQEIHSYYYSGPITLENKTNTPNVYAAISQTFEASHSQMPSTNITKANVVRAKAIDANNNQSETITATYFIGEEEEFESNFPIIFLSFSATDFFDFYNGIGVAGDDFESWRFSNPTAETWLRVPANYTRRGRDFEITSNFQYFEDEEEIFNKKIGVRIHGGASRSFPIKSLRLYARNEYSKNTLNHSFFSTEEFSAYRRLIIRNSGQDHAQTLFRDAFIQNLFIHLENDHQAYRPINLFLNGEYWGVMNIRERYGKQYFEMKYGIEEEDLDYLQNNMDVNEGDTSHYEAMLEFAKNADLSLDENFEYMKTQMDMDNYIDHYVANIYSANYDWPYNNIQYWRKRVDYTPDAPYGHDGRWRWVLQDMDAGFNGIPTWHQNSNLFNMLEHAIRRENLPDWSQELFKNLIANDEFVNNFTARMLDLLNTSLLKENVHELIQQFKDEYQPEIHKHINRWNFMEGLSEWDYQINKLNYFAEVRPDAVKEHLRDEFGYENEEVSLMIFSSNIEHGHVVLNRTPLHPTIPGVSRATFTTPLDFFGWSGQYFKDLKITLTAQPELGYTFSHWSGGVSNSTDASIEVNLQEHTQVTAHFEALPAEEIDTEPIHFWVMDTNIPNNTPLEELASTYSFEGLNASIEYTSCLTGYPFNENHENWRKASMERRNRPTEVNYIPEANFNFSFENVAMRGLQIRQPFENEGQKNQLIFKLNTTDFKEIKLSFAAKDEGAADGFEISYYDNLNNSWSSEGITPSYDLNTGEFNKYSIDFSDVTIANNANEFLVKLLFTGENLQEDNGDRVTFNNIAVLGKPTTMHVETPETQKEFSLYPNPVNSRFYIKGIKEGAIVEIYSITSKLLKREKYSNAGISVDDLSKGVYLLSIEQENKKSNLKLIKN